MDENEILVTEEVAENVETTTEETPTKTFTQEEVNEIVGKVRANARNKANKMVADVERKYSNLQATLEAGTGIQGVEKLDEVFTDHYTKRGINLPKKVTYTPEDIRVLAENDVREIIEAGDVDDELKRLVDKGTSKMSDREKEMYPMLMKHKADRKSYESLYRIGVTDEEINSKGYQNFRSQFNSNIPEEVRYELYRKTKPQKEHRSMGSMKQNPNTGVKDYYSPEEIERLTEEDLDDPKVWEAVRRSMTGG